MDYRSSWLDMGLTGFISLAPRFSAVSSTNRKFQPLQRFTTFTKTAEAVTKIDRGKNTSLKRGANEMSARRPVDCLEANATEIRHCGWVVANATELMPCSRAALVTAITNS